jgi:hypothetical protein
MTQPNKVRFEDDQIFVSLKPEDFDRSLRQLLDESDFEELDGICEAIVYCRGDLPPASSIWRERLYWLLGFLFIVFSIYGLATLATDLFSLGN